MSVAVYLPHVAIVCPTQSALKFGVFGQVNQKEGGLYDLNVDAEAVHIG